MAPPSWAYQVELFTPSPDEELICSICRCVFCEPMECPCQHAFCKACIARWLNIHRNCPICRKRTTEALLRPVIPLINNMIMKMNLRCHNQEAGCEATFMLEACESHVKECQFELIECSLGCGKLVFRKDVGNHKAVECPFRFTKCDTCKLKIYGAWEEHNCVDALMEAMREIEKERDDLKKEVEELKAKMRQMSKRRSSDQQDSSVSSFDGFWSYCSDTSHRSGSARPARAADFMEYSDSSDSDSSAYVDNDDDAAENPLSPLRYDSERDSSDNGEDQENDDDNNENQDELVLSRGRSLDDLLRNSFDQMHNEAADARDNIIEEQPALNVDAELPVYRERSPVETAGPDSTIVIGSSPSEGSEDESVPARLNRRRNLKRRLASENSLSADYDGGDNSDYGRKTHRPSSNEQSNEDSEHTVHQAELNISDNVAAYAMCSTSEQEAVPSTSTGVVASSVSRTARDIVSKAKRSSRLALKRSMGKKGSSPKKDGYGSNSSVGSQKSRREQSTIQRAFEGTLSLLQEHSIDSDPDWQPFQTKEDSLSSTSSSCSISTSSSNPEANDERNWKKSKEGATATAAATFSTGSSASSSSSDSYNYIDQSDDSIYETTETDSSLEIPPRTFDLLEEALDYNSEEDSDYIP